MGLSGKPQGIDGAQVDEMVRAGRIQEVAQYCESDVLNTYRLWLIYELFRGAITSDELKFSESQGREFIQTRKSDNRHLLDAVGINPQTPMLASTAKSLEPKPPANLPV
jgi:predicted PolB exonuclease-like 3'-5' exonuclease